MAEVKFSGLMLLGCLALSPGSVLAQAQGTGESAASGGNAQDGERLFRTNCGTCHSLEAGENRPTGPHLAGIFGRPAGAVEGFNYSPALRDADIVWDAESLDAFIADPRGTIPGNRMIYRGMPSADDRADLLAHLEEATGASSPEN